MNVLHFLMATMMISVIVCLWRLLDTVKAALFILTATRKTASLAFPYMLRDSIINNKRFCYGYD